MRIFTLLFILVVMQVPAFCATGFKFESSSATLNGSLDTSDYYINGFSFLKELSGGSVSLGRNANAVNSFSNSIFIGSGAGTPNNGANNVYVGNGAGLSSISDTRSVCLGGEACFRSGYTGGGSDNVAIGYRAGAALHGGARNVSIGSDSGDNVGSGNDNIYIGYNASGVNNPSGYLNIGNVVTGYNTVTDTMSFVGGVSAVFFVDRTPYPDSLSKAYAEIHSIKMDANKPGALDHDALLPSLKAPVEVMTLVGYSDEVSGKAVAGKSVSSGGKLLSVERKPIYEPITMPGRNLSETVSALTEVLKDLISRVEQLEK